MNIFLMYRLPLVYVINLVKATGCYIFGYQRIASSVGLEHYFDRVGVTGSNPVQSTSSIFSALYIPLLRSRRIEQAVRNVIRHQVSFQKSVESNIFGVLNPVPFLPVLP